MSPFCTLAFGSSCLVLLGVAGGAEPCAALCAPRLGPCAGRNPKLPRRPLSRGSPRCAGNLLPGKLPPAIFDLYRSILPFAHFHLPLCRCVLPALRLHLKQPIVVSHYPIHRRSGSASIRIPSSLAKCSAASVGPDRSPSLPCSVLLPHQLPHPPAKSHCLGSRARSSRTAMLQPSGPFLPIPLPQPLPAPVTQPTRLAASTTFSSLLFTRASASTRRSSLRLIPILPIRPPSDAVPQGTFLSRRKGDIIIEVQHTTFVTGSSGGHRNRSVSQVSSLVSLAQDTLAHRKFGGAGRDRTADKGFADLCLTTWRPRL